MDEKEEDDDHKQKEDDDHKQKEDDDHKLRDPARVDTPEGARIYLIELLEAVNAKLTPIEDQLQRLEDRQDRPSAHEVDGVAIWNEILNCECIQSIS
ncbi:hypothetical protein PPTG_14324 [Phytophthora nicotianae INRA-310]|uniref:Uncharacterized protein n=1 Tax=Phytophthora nicotianae (strain INRA-310) TaxID=761204 RepID=W2PY93_PHYN3|nr:hypothetical protein PPTG_14324 [Phytophthora nicotianae INRA-310]ETN05631.1 hypothetical protein PPTG_14324 [Phytophthora nicotianae INRA-310]